MELIIKYFSDFSETQIRQFQELGDLYKEWNEKINVVSRKDIESLYERHVLHSLSIAAEFDFIDGLEVIDIGTGGASSCPLERAMELEQTSFKERA
ncbi:MAG: class I SAM-dependent methyltransferase [Chitinophagaceae bacterium]|nr:class I SAM-dependent methyltransferase [Chitinophagaceae bacterium]